MAQPPLSVSIRKLEEEMGGALFSRTSKGVALTAAGEAMLQNARQALFHADQCRQMVSASLHGEGGVLRVGFIATATYELLPTLIPSFRQRYPKIDLELIEATTRDALDGVLSRQLDVGLVRYPLLENHRFRLAPLDDDEFVLAVPSDSKLAKKSSIPLSAAAEEGFIMYEPARVANLHAVAMMRCHQSGFSPRVVQEAIQVPTILSLVESGVGVALVAGVARRYQTRGVKFLSLTDTPRGFRIGIAAVTASEDNGLLVQAFVEHAVMVSSQLGVRS